jgi:hypothetical protein
LLALTHFAQPALAQKAETEAEGPAVAATPTPRPAAASGRRLHGTIKLLAFWEDVIQDGFLVHVRLLIQNDDDVRLYPADFIYTTGGGLGDEFKGLRPRQKVLTNHGLDYPIDEKEDISACCGNPKLLPADNQIVKVVTFLIPTKTPNHQDFRISWRIQPPPTGDDAPSAGPDDAPNSGGAKRSLLGR